MTSFEKHPGGAGGADPTVTPPTATPPTATPPAGSSPAGPPVPGTAPGSGIAAFVDPATGIAIPAGTAIASTGRRIGGYFMEILLYVVTLAIGYVVWSVIVWARGQTPGKQVLGMRCVRPEEQRVAGWGWMFLRTFVGGWLTGLTGGILFVVDGVMLIVRPDRRTALDFLAGTVVVHDPDRVLA